MMTRRERWLPLLRVHEEVAEVGEAAPQSCLESILSGHLDEPGVSDGRMRGVRGGGGER